MPKETDFDPGKLAADKKLVERDFWTKLRTNLGRIPFAQDVLAGFYCATDRATPAYVRALLFGALAYFIVPTDVIPDFIAGLGFTDDASVIAAALSAIGRYVKQEHRERARHWLSDHRDKLAPTDTEAADEKTADDEKPAA
ncbi:YkvA family protein [Oceanibacterium hippocampi]|uniref:DUF1232 domain-containing protein n=1 Tax=Oceanibacterium hippocampi TaxID=745714 RepID=A0A1Y5RDL8_9PROT|nr:YkvA family protein [Oceanibacterium hippocampi]SLN12268.1 hypothetical protein OCH7691_00141 [Oceanibacterium hippocampi]